MQLYVLGALLDNYSITLANIKEKTPVKTKIRTVACKKKRNIKNEKESMFSTPASNKKDGFANSKMKKSSVIQKCKDSNRTPQNFCIDCNHPR
mmetsp:Transcript_10543/g.13688  ORF Transcript_10543/g.13688 Transcript_10543/m.13688 type:complete len:93 (+) Transcript_10543:78-356(+)